MLPEGWKVGVIEDISKVSSGGTPNRKVDEYWRDGEIPWVTTAEVKFGVITGTEQKITTEGLNNSSAKLFPQDTILIAMYGQGRTRGQVAKLGIEASTNQACAAIQLKQGYNVDYYYHYLKSQYLNIRDLANSGGQKNLSSGIVKSINVPIPPLPEQRKIAKILSTWDKAISTTERLIDNSKQQKKALMQQLLTGKKRLLDDSGRPFEGEWEEFSLVDLVAREKYSFTGGPFGSDLKSSDYTSNGVRIIQLQNIGDGRFNNKYKVFTSDEKANELISCNIFPGEIIISKMGDPVARATIIPPFHSRYLMASDGIRLKVDQSRFNTEFILEKINSSDFRNLAVSRSTGSTRRRIGLTDLKSIRVRIPSLNEQQKIASVLTNADKEIERLEQQLADLKQEKRALMQQLLTGKRRVKLDDTAAA